MTALEISRYIFWVIFLCSALVAVLTQIQIRVDSDGSSNGEVSKLNSRHRWTGWLALCALVLILASSLIMGSGLPKILAQINLIHIPLMTICAVVYLRKVWVTKKMLKLSMNQRFLWWGIMCTLGMCFFAISFGLAIWYLLKVNPVLANNIWRLLLIGHTGLALGLIWLGRLALRKGKRTELNYHKKQWNWREKIPVVLGLTLIINKKKALSMTSRRYPWIRKNLY